PVVRSTRRIESGIVGHRNTGIGKAGRYEMPVGVVLRRLLGYGIFASDIGIIAKTGGSIRLTATARDLHDIDREDAVRRLRNSRPYNHPIGVTGRSIHQVDGFLAAR